MYPPSRTSTAPGVCGGVRSKSRRCSPMCSRTGVSTR